MSSYYLVITWLLAALLAVASGQTTPASVKANATAKSSLSTQQRDRRQLTSSSASTGTGYPVYYDGLLNPPVQTLQPITVVAPLNSNGNGQHVGPPQPQPGQTGPGYLPNLPIIGTLVGNWPQQSGTANVGLLPALISGLGSLGGLGGFGVNLGNLGLGGGGSGGAGSLTPGNGNGNGNGNAVGSCPLNQKLNCRCEPLLGIPSKPLGVARQQQLVQIVQQNTRRLPEGGQELRLLLSNGLIVYQRSSKQQPVESVASQGFYALRLHDGRYFNIHYNINTQDYTVKADVTNTPPKTDLDEQL